VASSLPSTTTFAAASPLPQQQPPLYSSSGSSGSTQPLFGSSQAATYATQMPLPQTPLPQTPLPSDLSAEGAQLYGDVNAALAAQNTTMIAASVKALVTRARAQQPAQAADKSSEFHKHCVALATAAREACATVNGGSAAAAVAQRVQSAAASLAQFV